MAPVLYPCQLQLMPYTSPHPLRSMWHRLYPHDDDPAYRVYREHLADSVYEYHAVVTLRTSSSAGSYTRTSWSSYASTAVRPSSMLHSRFLLSYAMLRLGCRTTHVFVSTHPCMMMVVFAFIPLMWRLIVTLATFLDISLLVIF